MSITDWLTPAADILLVARDEESRVVGSIIRPDNASELRPWCSGTVLKAGPDALYEAGTRVAFGAHAMTVLGLEDERAGEANGDASARSAVGFLPSTEVLCTFDRASATPEALPDPLDLAGADYARAPRGFLLVERSSLPIERRSIVIPGSYADAIRSMEATVRDVGCARSPFSVGDVVLINGYVGRHVTFGLYGDLRTLYAALPSQIVGWVTAPLPALMAADESANNPLRYRGPLHLDPNPRWDEGDRRAPR